MKVEIDTFSGYKIYPSKGRLFVRGDSKIFRFAKSKTESLALQRKNPRKLHWTQGYRREQKKGITTEAAKKRSRRTVKSQRAIYISGISPEAIAARQKETAAARLKARQDITAKAKQDKSAKAAKKTTVKPNIPSGPKVSKQQMKGGKGGR